MPRILLNAESEDAKLTALSTVIAIAGTEVLYGVQEGVSKKFPVSLIGSGGGGGSAIFIDTFVATAGQVDFVLTNPLATVLNVFVAGVKARRSAPSDYSIDTVLTVSTITIISLFPPQEGEEVEIHYL